MDLARVKRWCSNESPAGPADDLRVEYHVRGKSVTLCETRPPWDGRDGEWTHLDIAQLRYRPDTTDWSLHWSDRNSRWHPYDPDGYHVTGSAADLLAEVDRDPDCVFRG